MATNTSGHKYKWPQAKYGVTFHAMATFVSDQFYKWLVLETASFVDDRFCEWGDLPVKSLNLDFHVSDIDVK